MSRYFKLAAPLAMLCSLLSGCMGDLPPSEFPCLVAEDRYNKYNETYVFSPMGDKDQAERLAQEAEAACVQEGKKIGE